MNYLAHLFLAGERDEAKIGGLLGDFVKGSIKGRYGPEIELEIEIHRKIDFYTDHHAVIKESKKIWPEPKRRYAGVLLDVFYDHLLAARWPAYSAVHLGDFIRRMYAILLRHRAALPDRLNRIVPYMIEQDWLSAYRDYSGFELTIKRISGRLTRPERLIEGLPEVAEHYALLASGFETFFPDLIEFAKEQRALLSAAPPG